MSTSKERKSIILFSRNFQLIALVGLIAAVNAGLLPAKAIVKRNAQVDDYDTHPQYSFNYGVSDPTTGDHKTQEETRDGDVVRGSYSLVEPDGTRRIVDYTADGVNGFNAVVRREPAGVSAPTARTAPEIYSATPGYRNVAFSPVQAYNVAPVQAYNAAPYFAYGSSPAVYPTYSNVPRYENYYA